MKSKHGKVLGLIGTYILTIGCLAGCGNSNHENQAAINHSQTELSGNIRMVGSTSMEKISNALLETFMERYPNVIVTAEFVGSGAGVEAVNNGSGDIGNSSRYLKEEEKAAGAVENIVAIDGIAVCVDSTNQVAGVDRKQLAQIYTGQITNWKEVGGADAPIVVVGREAGSGTRAAFEELLGIEDACAYANELDSTGAVMAKVAATPGAIGYLSIDALNESVTALSIEGVDATAENIKAGKYFLSRPFIMATKGEIAEQGELVQEWFAFVLGKEGQQIATEVGLISVQ